MESGTYEVAFCPNLETDPVAIGSFHVFAGEAYAISPSLEENLNHATLDEIIRLYGHSPYYVIQRVTIGGAE